jgi:nucleotide-binding universal stress UspA family protein
MKFMHVLVAADGSEFAAHALEVASGLATALSAQIWVVHVIPPGRHSVERDRPSGIAE